MDYLIILLSAISLILLFKFQRLVRSPFYFAFSDVIGEVSTWKLIIGRISIILVHNTLLYVVLKYFLHKSNILEIMLVSNFLGTLLIVWPLLYAPRNNLLINPSAKTMMIMYLYYFCFVGGSAILAYVNFYYICGIFFEGKTLMDIWKENGPGTIIGFFFALVFQGGANPLSKLLMNSFDEDRNSGKNIFKE